MDKSVLNNLFQKYIDGFEMINSPENDETYKWAIAHDWKELFDINASDFSAMLYKVLPTTVNLIDNATVQPLNGLCVYAKHEPETVREMFQNLFGAREDNIDTLQSRIDNFIISNERLTDKYAPGSWRFANAQNTVMAYIFLNDPDNNFLYKSTEVHKFANCVNFSGELGSGKSFNIKEYYKLCNEIVEAIKEYPELIETHKSRYINEKRELYDDSNLHLLAFDVIYSTIHYNLAEEIVYAKLSPKERNLAIERQQKANVLQNQYDAAYADAKDLEEIQCHVNECIKAGMQVTHNKYGQGVIENISEDRIVIAFDGGKTTKTFGLYYTLATGGITLDNQELNEYVKANREILKHAPEIKQRVENAEKALEPYAEYIDQ